MNRLLVPASGLVLALTACGGGAKPAPQPIEVTGAAPPSVHAIAARRERAARGEAEQLLREFVPPPEARPTREPRNYGGVLRRSGPEPPAEIVDVHRFWSVQKSLAAVMAFVRAHEVAGFERFAGTYGTSPPHYVTLTFSWPSARDPRRLLDVTAVELPHRTVLRVDAKVVWAYPRSPSEKVPAGARVIAVDAPNVSMKVTRSAEVASIVRRLDALPVSPPGVAIPCPAMVGPEIEISFRDARGAWLAEAKAPPARAGICNAIEFRVGGHAQQPLVDRSGGKSFVEHLQRLLHVRLVETYR
jgi:hypothetical protein